MKVVINRCFGGFGLSPKAEDLYMEKKSGTKLFRYVQTKYEHCDGSDEYKRIDSTEEISLFNHTTSKDYGKTVKKLESGEGSGYVYFGDVDREDPILIEVIDELGKEASGAFGNLEIVEIPDGVKYEIDEYDGYESIHEKHRSWG